jgi:D-sedoheptulose 7-phosphate isomerase
MDFVQEYLKGVKACIDELSEENIGNIVKLLFGAYLSNRQVYIMGNGGSATTAMHFARDLQIGAAFKDNHRLRATCLVDNMAFVTAIANDISYEAIFEEQLKSVVKKGDIVIGISASGNSPNILKGIEYARKDGAYTIGFIGFGGGKLKDIVDYSVTLSSKSYQQVEDVHMVLVHVISLLVKEKISAQ